MGIQQLRRRTSHPLRVLGYLLMIGVAVALLAYGCHRSAGAWHVEAPGPAPAARSAQL